MKNVNNFQIGKFNLKVLLSICLIFCRFQPGVAYKKIAYKTSVYSKVKVTGTSECVPLTSRRSLFKPEKVDLTANLKILVEKC